MYLPTCSGVCSTKSASLEDVHPTSDMFSAVDEEVE